MNRRRFDRLVGKAMESLPDEFHGYLDNVIVTVQDEPSDELLEEMGEESLLGVYLGTPLTERSHQDSFMMPDQIIVFQGPLEEMCETEDDIVEQVRITVVHEVGHHFGLSDGEIEAILGP